MYWLISQFTRVDLKIEKHKKTQTKARQNISCLWPSVQKDSKAPRFLHKKTCELEFLILWIFVESNYLWKPDTEKKLICAFQKTSADNVSELCCQFNTAEEADMSGNICQLYKACGQRKHGSISTEPEWKLSGQAEISASVLSLTTDRWLAGVSGSFSFFSF